MKIFIPFKVAAFVLLFPTSEMVSDLALKSSLVAKEARVKSDIVGSPVLALPPRAESFVQSNLLIPPPRGSEIPTSRALMESIGIGSSGAALDGQTGIRADTDPSSSRVEHLMHAGVFAGAFVMPQHVSSIVPGSSILTHPPTTFPLTSALPLSSGFPLSSGLLSRRGFANLLTTVLGPNSDTSRNWISPRGKVVYSDSQAPEELILKRREPATPPDELVFRGVVDRAVAPALRQAGVRPDLIDDFVDLFSNSVDFRRDIHRGDSFSLFVKRDPAKKSYFISAASLKSRGKLMVAVRHVGADGVARYFDARGFPREEGLLRYPVQFTRISSVFSDSRLHPVLKISRPHLGVDFAAPVGTPVRAAGDGIVTFAGRHGAGGITVKIQHDSRYATSYLHLSHIERGIHTKTRVRKGQIIGAVGKTGLATGAHLHFSLWDRGRYIDPLNAKVMPTVHRRDMIPQKLLLARVESLKALHSGVIAVALNKREGSRAG